VRLDRLRDAFRAGARGPRTGHRRAQSLRAAPPRDSATGAGCAAKLAGWPFRDREPGRRPGVRGAARRRGQYLTASRSASDLAGVAFSCVIPREGRGR
jgi:hypothetical protein